MQDIQYDKWIITRHFDKIAMRYRSKEGLEKLVNGNKRIIGKGVYGKIYDLLLGGRHKYVLKEQFIGSRYGRIDKGLLNTALNELYILSLSNIQYVSVYCYAYKIDTTTQKVYFVMDHWEEGNAANTSMTLSAYLNKHFTNECPAVNHPLYINLYITLLNMYKILKVAHGDLHVENIAIVFDGNSTKTGNNIKRVIIFDFGASTVINSNEVNKLNCLGDILKYSKSYLKERYPLIKNERFPDLLNRGNMQPLRPNLTLLTNPKHAKNMKGFNLEEINKMYKEMINSKNKNDSVPMNINNEHIDTGPMGINKKTNQVLEKISTTPKNTSRRKLKNPKTQKRRKNIFSILDF